MYNIFGDEYHDIKSLSNMILDELNKDDSQVNYVDIEHHNTLDKKGSNEKAKKDLGHEVTISLKEGIKKTIEWQKREYEI